MSEILSHIQALLALTQTELGIANTRRQVAFPAARVPQIEAQIAVMENALAAAQAAELAGNAPAVAAELENAKAGREAAAARYDGGWATSDPIYLGDIGRRERRREVELKAERHTLERLLIERGEGRRDATGRFQPLPNGPETAALRQWKKLDALLGEAVLDPLVRNTIKAGKYTNVHLVRGMFRRVAAANDAPKTLVELNDNERELVAVLGILLRERAGPDDDGQISQRFASSVAKAQGEYRANQPLFDKVLELLAETGKRRTDTTGDPPTERDWLAVPKVAEVTVGDLARIVKELARRGIRANDVYLETYVDDLVSNTSGIGDGAEPASIDIALPNLDAETDIEIVKENLHAMQCIYFSATLEDLKLFSVCDKLVESFHQGMLPIGRGTGGNLLYQYWKRSLNRFTEVERRNLYARAFGFPGGDVVTGTPNREFTDLWLRFISAVAEFDRQLTVNDLVTSRTPVSVTQERVRKAGRDLAANLSLYGYGVAYFAATELQEQIKDILAILNDVDVRSSYGARDVWQVVDQVATFELGGARNSVRYRTMANAGAIIIRWLANNAEQLASVGRARLLDPASLNSDVDDPTRRPMENPSNRDLVDACQQWLAVTGTQDAQIEEFSQSVEGPTMTSRPIQIPSIARDLLDAAGIAPMSMQYN